MTPFAFDTLSASKQLREAGMPEGVAEAVVAVFQHASAMPDISHLATKADVEAQRLATKADLETQRLATKADLEAQGAATKAGLDALSLTTKADLEVLRLATKADMELLRAETRADIEALRMTTKEDIAQVRLEVANFRAAITDTIRQQGWLVLGGVGVLLTISNGIVKLFG